MPPFGLGGQPRRKDDRDFALQLYQTPVSIPPEFISDLSNLPVKDQGTYPTCGAHAGACLDSKLQADKRKAARDLSPKYLWKQIKLIDCWPLGKGTDMRSIFKSLQNTGDCQESLMPNTLDASLEAYSDARAITDTERHDAYQNDLTAFAFVDKPSWDQMRQAIYQNKAVLVLVECGDGWWTPSWAERDILPLRLGKFDDNHFIVLYGYDERYIYFRNSWSDKWGRQGNGYFDRSYVPHILELGTTLVLPTPYLFTDKLHIGMSGNHILQLQKFLNADPATQIARKGAGSPGNETSFLGLATFAAVRNFQKRHGLSVSGFVGPLTLAALNTSTRQPARIK